MNENKLYAMSIMAVQPAIMAVDCNCNGDGNAMACINCVESREIIIK